MSFTVCNIFKIEDGYQPPSLEVIGNRHCWRFRVDGDTLYLEYRIINTWFFVWSFTEATAGSWTFTYNTTGGNHQLELYKGATLVAILGTVPDTGTLECWQFTVNENLTAQLQAIVDGTVEDVTLSSSGAGPGTCGFAAGIPFNSGVSLVAC